MIVRCRSKNSTSYPSYGAKGISVCDRWDKFENFLEDMGERPRGMDLDRINPKDNYYKENCRWITKSENSKRTGKYFLFRNEMKTISQLSREYGVLQSTLHFRVCKLGWPLERAIIPTRGGK